LPLQLTALSKFEVDDAEKQWTFKDNTFDFIHFRNLRQGITNWPFVLKEAHRCLKPGGYIELAETRGECSSIFSLALSFADWYCVSKLGCTATTAQ
jgi:ubiquinone/menaquinone biosynthesis C-methylase UbiE